MNRPVGRGGTILVNTHIEDTFLMIGGADRQPTEFGDGWLIKVVRDGDGMKYGYKKLNIDEKFRPRTGHSGNLYKGKIYIFGGQSYKQNRHTNEVWVYNIHTETIDMIDTTNTPKPRNSHGSCVDDINGYLYIYGGADEEGLLGDMHRYMMCDVQIRPVY